MKTKQKKKKKIYFICIQTLVQCLVGDTRVTQGPWLGIPPHYLAKSDLELKILLPQLLEDNNSRTFLFLKGLALEGLTVGSGNLSLLAGSLNSSSSFRIPCLCCRVDGQGESRIPHCEARAQLRIWENGYHRLRNPAQQE